METVTSSHATMVDYYWLIVVTDFKSTHLKYKSAVTLADAWPFQDIVICDVYVPALGDRTETPRSTHLYMESHKEGGGLWSDISRNNNRGQHKQSIRFPVLTVNQAGWGLVMWVVLWWGGGGWGWMKLHTFKSSLVFDDPLFGRSQYKNVIGCFNSIRCGFSHKIVKTGQVKREMSSRMCII